MGGDNRMIKKFIANLVDKKTLLLILRRFAKLTDNSIDDKVVSLIEGCLYNQSVKIRSAAEQLVR